MVLAEGSRNKKSSLKVRKLAFLSRYFLYISEYEIKTHELP